MIGDDKAPKKGQKKKDGSWNFLTWEQVQQYDSFGAIMHQGYVDISFDTEKLSDIFWNMSDKNGWENGAINNPSNNHIHSYWKDTQNRISSDGKDKKLAVGLIADIHSKGTYIPLKVNGVERKAIYEPDQIDEVPDELIPVNTQISLLDMVEGDGRDSDLYRYGLVLQSQVIDDKDVIRHIVNNINNFIFQEPLSQDDIDRITRDEAFAKPVFYNGKTFLHNVFVII